MGDFLMTALFVSVTLNLAAAKYFFDSNKYEKEQRVKLLLAKKDLWRLKHGRKRKVMRFLNPYGMPQDRLNKEISCLQDNGWEFDREYSSTNGLLAFYREEDKGESTN